MNRFAGYLAVFVLLAVFGLCSGAVRAADPTGSATSVTIPVNDDCTTVTLRIVPGERRIVRAYLKKNWSETVDCDDYGSFTLLFKNDAGVNVSSQTMSVESANEGKLAVLLSANKITKDCKKGAVLCWKSGASSGTVTVIAGWFTVATQSVNLP